MRKFFAAVFVVLGLAIFGATPSQAEEVPTWVTNQESAILSPTEAVLKGTNTSVETTNLDRPIQTGQSVTVEFELGEGAVCSGGAPRIFIELDGVYSESWGQGDNTCADTVLTVTAPTNGRIGAAGIVYDNGTAGEVLISNLKVNGELVYFQQPLIEVDLINPHTIDAECGPPKVPAFLVLPEVEGLANYVVNDELHPNGTRITVPEGKYVIDAVAAEGYTLPDSYEGWSFRVTYPECPTPTPTPTPTPDPTDTPTPTPTPDPTATPTATPTPTEDPEPTPSASPTGDDEELPDTGPDGTLWTAIAGLGLLVAGSVVLLRLRTQ